MSDGQERAARAIGTGESIGTYVIADDQMAAGSTLGGPLLCMTIKASGAVEKIYSIEVGEALFGTLVLHFWDTGTGTKLQPMPGEFVIHPEHQEHLYELPNHVSVHETLFALSGKPDDGEVDPPAAYYRVELRNNGAQRMAFSSYALCQLRGQTSHDVVASYDAQRRAFVVWNVGQPQNVRLFGVSEQPAGYETTIDHDKALSFRRPGQLANTTDTPPGQDTLGIFELAHDLAAGDSTEFFFKFSFSTNGRADAEHAFDSTPGAADALERTKSYFANILGNSVLITPDDDLNRGVLWAKANMLRTVLKPPTGWSLVNDPTKDRLRDEQPPDRWSARQPVLCGR